MRRSQVNLPARKFTVIGAVMAIMMASALPGIASAVPLEMPVLIDGIFDGNDMYTNETNTQFVNDHHTQYAIDDPANTTTIRWNDHENGLYIYTEVSLKLKNMIWGTGVSPEELALYYQGWCDAPGDGESCTHHNKDGFGGDPSSGTEPLVLDYNRATGSEKFIFAATSVGEETGKNGEPKVKVEGGIKVDLADYPDPVVPPPDGELPTKLQTSVDWVLNNFPGCDKVNCAASNIPMSVEMLVEGDTRDAILDWLGLWDDYNGNNNGLLDLAMPAPLIAHLSPERGGVVPAVPVPAAFWLFGTALIGFIGISRRTNLA